MDAAKRASIGPAYCEQGSATLFPYYHVLLSALGIGELSARIAEFSQPRSGLTLAHR